MKAEHCSRTDLSTTKVDRLELNLAFRAAIPVLL